MNSTFTASFPLCHVREKSYFILLFLFLVSCLLVMGGILAQLYNADAFDDSQARVVWMHNMLQGISLFNDSGVSIVLAFTCAALHCLASFRSTARQYTIIQMPANGSQQVNAESVKKYKTILIACVAALFLLSPGKAQAQTPERAEVAACDGQLVTFSVPVDKVSYIQWWYKINLDEPWVIIEGANNYTYTVQATSANNNYIYEADYYDGNDGLENCFGYKLKVNPLPVMPAATGASRQGTGTVTLTASGVPTGGSYRWYTEAANGTSITGATGASYSTPSINKTTTYYVATVNAAGCESARKAVTATIVNTAPSVPADVNAAVNTVAEKAANGTLVGITASSTDPEANPITYLLTNNAGGRFAINATTGVVTVANGTLLSFKTAATHTITVQASDGSLSSDTRDFSIAVTRVNVAPVAKPVLNATLLNTAAATQLASLTATDDGTVYTFRITSNPSAGVLYVNGKQVILNTDYPWSQAGTLTYAPVASNLSDIQVNYLVTDEEGMQSSPVTITIPINGAPIATAVTNSKTLSTSAPRTAINSLKGNDAEAEGVITHFKITSIPIATKGVLYVDGVEAVKDKEYSWASKTLLSFDPAYGNSSNVGFSFVLKDAEGAYSATPALYKIYVMLDYDLDGIADATDLDDDNDGIPDAMEGTTDKDGDGIINSLDLDADGDGIPDALEFVSDPNLLAYYKTATGRFAGAVGKNGLLDALETSPDSGILRSSLVLPDTDRDGLPDFLDVDSDNDGLPDNLEAQLSGYRILASGKDADRDGLDDSYDATCGCPENGQALAPVDFDRDELPDYLDLDSDNDHHSDTAEAFDLDKDGNALNDLKAMVNSYFKRTGTSATTGTYNFDDLNKNQVPDMFDDDNKNGRLNLLEPGHKYYRDANNNGIIDLFDNTDLNTTLSPNYAFRSVSLKAQLPVTLAKLAASTQTQGISINWETATEVENNFFVVERSLDGSSFEKISKVKGAGSSTRRLTYTYLDKTAPAAEVYYRLKQVDFDGKNTYSKIVSVAHKRSAATGMLLYPNPATAYVKLNLAGLPAATYQVRVVSMEGRVVHTLTTQHNAELVIDTHALPVGKYLLQIQSDAMSETLSFIKQ